MRSEPSDRRETFCQLGSALHVPVLLLEAIESLNIKPEGIYVDGTFGRGGHAKEILKKLKGDGLLVAIDKDPQAIAEGEKFESNNFRIVQGTFADIKNILAQIGIKQVDGILLDLGVSSPQLDTAGRGFSFALDGPLDMRMDTNSGMTAEEWINTAAESEIIRILRIYGEERFAPRIAKFIVAARALERLSTTRQLGHVVERAIPKKFQSSKNPATKTYQAIRIHLNREMEDLDHFLSQVTSILLGGARLVIISFHSLEDRKVKHFFARESQSNVPDRMPIREVDLPKPLLKVMGKAVRPSILEIDRNPRSRSATMRVAERCVS
ncbi:MAG: 16S rRNA (cytosine(1402)-N(4))-methyltransferase RsmH [Proteobacteria bacterium]|nr:16S rRNA (cytosine(1402)-N(4))-methyltransferase RsmH [Pseudomonadota bacterium]MDA1331103.1 16S rRNA (cytosine(1402)-N(4))-methyltransferase RsmH [Pseudomonadota bacterium]